MAYAITVNKGSGWWWWWWWVFVPRYHHLSLDSIINQLLYTHLKQTRPCRLQFVEWKFWFCSLTITRSWLKCELSRPQRLH
uniref:Uncharacterized protein n=1 Tax=Salix viminalis TaxID=40686 RepID=A0A6N2LA71_SALVM